MKPFTPSKNELTVVIEPGRYSLIDGKLTICGEHNKPVVKKGHMTALAIAAWVKVVALCAPIVRAAMKLAR